MSRLGGIGESITPFKGAQLNLNNITALPNNMMQSQGSVEERTSQPRDMQSQLSSAR
jgi:hypothetical protein